MIDMRAGITLFLALLLVTAGLHVVSASGIDYHLANSNDYGAYLYFMSLLRDFQSLYDIVLAENDSAVNVSSELYTVTNSTYGTVIMYSSGSSGKIVSLAADFRELGECSFYISSGAAGFRVAMDDADYVNARNSLILMEVGISSCREALLSISSVALVGENNETLHLDVGELSSRLEGLESLLSDYRRRLESVEAPSNFSVFISKPDPMVLENITIFGYAPNMSVVLVMVNGTMYTPEVASGTFRLVYTFPQTGEYEIYAVGVNASGSFRSNVLTVNVSRIPTRIVAEESLGETVTISGYLLDYWGRGVSRVPIKLVVGGSVYTLVTTQEGFFNTTVNVSSEVNATLIFRGSPYYAPSNATLLLLPAKLKPTIRLFYDGGSVRAGDTVTITGKVSPDVAVPLVIYVDDSPYTTLNARGEFSFQVQLSEGEHRIYAYFPGSGELQASRSNVVQITATPISYTLRFLLLLLFLLAAGVAYKFLTKEKPAKTSPETVPEKAGVESEAGSAKPDVLRAYRVVYRFLRRFYSLPSSITPRELLERFRGEPFHDDLAELTGMHERSLYGRVRFGLSEAIGAVKRASRVIITAIVRDEL
ncbi:Ig-like domain repeat protein [Thermococcus sp. ES12]|uniref:Ig-like domain repeat protein n=1 Tax=Thermococcus sp. ES12 TaxID=1638246 RepID=UPI001430DDD2|nr:Ig-like domain repeat protein [Thermococcus sp. ES12]NJE77292.1 Ig-like domain repeat protein [Thermococcus sp. ES12]